MFDQLCIFTVTILCAFLQSSSGEWLKIQGDDVGNQPSVTKAIVGAQLPGSRSGSASWLEESGILWLFGGIGYDSSSADSPHHLNDLWQYNTTSKQWHLAHRGRAAVKIKPNETRVVPKPRRGALACGVPGILLFLFGGESYNNEKLFDTWLYRLHNVSWVPLLYGTDLNPVHPPARSDPSAWCMNDRIVMYGGVGRDGALLDDLWQFSLWTLEWSILRQHSNQTDQRDPMLPGVRMGASTWIYNSSLFMFGGSSNSATTELYLQPGKSLLSDLWQYNISSNTWYLLHGNKVTGTDEGTSSCPSGRVFAGSVTHKNLLYLIGGYGLDMQDKQDFLLDIWQYDKNTTLWTQSDVEKSLENKEESHKKFQQQFPTPRCDGTIWCYNNILYLFGGFGLDKKSHVSTLNDLYVNTNDKNMLSEFGPPTETYLNRFMTELPPSVIFAICFGTFGGLVLIFGAMFCMKKMIDFPNHGPIKLKKYNRKDVKYVRVEDDVTVDM